MSVQRCAVALTRIFHVDGEEICQGEACLNSSVNKFYVTIQSIQDFFFAYFNYCGSDGRGGMHPIYLGWSEENAAWACTHQNCFWIFNDSLAENEEVAAHEYAHAVQTHIVSLEGSGQTGAIKEGFANAMAITYKRNWRGQLDWKIGNLYDLSVCRRLSDVKDISSAEDNGHVHANSLILTHAFYFTVATENVPSLKVAQIWFAALPHLTYSASFSDFAFRTLDQARRLFGAQTTSSVVKGWLHVGVLELAPARPLPERRVMPVVTRQRALYPNWAF